MPRNLPERVTIDGVEYVPVLGASPDIREIAKAIVSLWYGPGDDKELVLKVDSLHINVNDNGQGEPLEEALAKIACFLRKSQFPTTPEGL